MELVMFDYDLTDAPDFSSLFLPFPLLFLLVLFTFDAIYL